MRRYAQKESTLKQIADEIAKTIVIRNPDDTETTRDTTESEKQTIANIAFGALLGLQWGEDVRSRRDLEQAIVDTIEFVTLVSLPYCNSYQTIYLPLKRVLRDWDEIITKLEGDEAKTA